MSNLNKKFNKLVKHFKSAEKGTDHAYDWDGEEEGSFNSEGLVIDYDSVLGEETFISFTCNANRTDRCDRGDYWTPDSWETVYEEIENDIDEVYYQGEKIELTINQTRVLEALISDATEIE